MRLAVGSEALRRERERLRAMVAPGALVDARDLQRTTARLCWAVLVPVLEEGPREVEATLRAVPLGRALAQLAELTGKRGAVRAGGVLGDLREAVERSGIGWPDLVPDDLARTLLEEAPAGISGPPGAA